MNSMSRDPFDESETTSGETTPRAARVGGAVLSVLLVAGVGFWTYQIGQQDAAQVPVIQALEGPAKLQPEDPEGLRVDHQGLTVTAIVEGIPPAPRPGDVRRAPPVAELADEDVAAADLPPVAELSPESRAVDDQDAAPLPDRVDQGPALADPLDDPPAELTVAPPAPLAPPSADAINDPEIAAVQDLPPALRPRNLPRPAQTPDRPNLPSSPEDNLETAPSPLPSQSLPPTPQADALPDAAVVPRGPDSTPAVPSAPPVEVVPDLATVGDPDPDAAVASDPPAQPSLDAADLTPQAAPDADADLTVTDGAPQIAPRPTPRPAGFVPPVSETPVSETPASPSSDDAAPNAAPASPDQTPPDQTPPDQTTPDQIAAEQASDSPEPVTRSLTPQADANDQDDPPNPEQAQQIDPERAAFPPTGTQLIQLGAFDSPEVARAEWTRLVRAHGDLLGTKGPLVQRTVVSGRVFFRLRAEGFANRAEARATCSALNARGLPCITRVQE
ncbi:MAG: SPOR domain-containing protein [Pseudomonadota bacterium]